MTVLLWVVALVLGLALVNVVACWLGFDVAGAAETPDDEHGVDIETSPGGERPPHAHHASPAEVG